MDDPEIQAIILKGKRLRNSVALLTQISNFLVILPQHTYIYNVHVYGVYSMYNPLYMYTTHTNLGSIK